MASTVKETAAPFVELEEVDGVKALEWVKERNRESAARFDKVIPGVPTLAELKTDLLKILQAKDRIPSISIRTSSDGQSMVYNFWQDAKNPKGIYRRQTLEAYQANSEEWETLLDIDALSKKEKENWVFKGASCAPKVRTRCMVRLSRGGGDASVDREFDVEQKDFVKGGFQLPEAKSTFGWLDDDTLMGGIPIEGETSDSGYPTTVRMWKRGDDLKKSTIVFRGEKTDIGVWGRRLRSHHSQKGHGQKGEEPVVLDLIVRAIDMNTVETYVRMPNDSWRLLPIPKTADVEGLSGQFVLFATRKDGEAFGTKLRSGWLYAFDLSSWMDGGAAEKTVKVETVFRPTAKRVFSYLTTTKSRIVLSYMDNVRGRLVEMKRGANGVWTEHALKLPGSEGAISASYSSYDEEYFTVFYQDFLTPSEMFLVDGARKLTKLRTTPARFDAKG
ncbi:MAG: hypothetical protein RBT63_10955, partial [Bdellovibrionales bacterium]|nr:hypothetical protein [Bdellovibrionales bacterium]